MITIGKHIGMDSRYEKLMRHRRLRNHLSCDYCGILKNNCIRARQPRPDRYKNHRPRGGS